MTRLKAIGAVAVIAASILGAATPASAVITTFATYSSITSGHNLSWTKVGTAGGTVKTISTPTSNVLGATSVNFNFLQASLVSLGALASNFTLQGTSSASPAVAVGSFLVQPVVSGSFSFIYTGPSFTVGATTYVAGTNLLSGVFTNAEIFGQSAATSGSLSASTGSGGSITYTSDLLDFTNTISQDYAISLTAITPAIFRQNASSSLRSFKASTGGSFSTDPAPIVVAVPEPATWAMLVAGFGLVGVSLRRRKPRSVAA